MAKLIDLGNINTDNNKKPSKHNSGKTTLPQKAAKTNLQTTTFLRNDTNSPIGSFRPTFPLIDQQLTKFKPKKKKKKLWKRIGLVVLFLVLLFGIIAGLKISNLVSDFKKSGIDVNVFDALGHVVNPQNTQKLLMDGNLTNTLVIGVDSRSSGGGGLENTDSIMIISYNNDTKRAITISIPRDMEGIFRVGKNNSTVIKTQKINSAYAIAQEYNYPGGGLALLRQAISEEFGINIQYTMQINFKAFKDVIDRVGGITVDVENSFTDYTYPNDTDTGLITVSFKQGVQQMNGTKALQYARSRHSADNGEGSDFSRAKRQQKVLQAVADKLKTTNYVTDPNAVFDFIKIFGDNVKIEKTPNINNLSTNVNTNDILAVLSLKDNLDTKKISSAVLDPSSGGCNSVIKKLDDTDAYMIGPTAGWAKFDTVKTYVQWMLNNTDLYNENKQNCTGERAGTEIGVVDNGLGYTATLAQATTINKEYLSATYLSQLVAPINLTAGSTDVSTNLKGVGVYFVTPNKPATLAYLKTKYPNLTVLTADLIPDSVKKLTKNVDIVIFYTK